MNANALAKLRKRIEHIAQLLETRSIIEMNWYQDVFIVDMPSASAYVFNEDLLLGLME